MKRCVICLMAVMALGACSGVALFEKGGEEVDVSGSISHGMIVLGEQLQDPYSLEIVTKAVSSLYPEKARIDIRATDLYVRFLPATEEDYSVLEDMGVQMIDHPLDYRIVREGDYYHDPDIPDSLMTWQYAVVDPDFVFPEGIEHEILDECYISENDVTTRSSGIDWAEVEREAYRLSGNGDMICSTKGATYPAAKPKGRIAIVDRKLDSEPAGVAGVKVSANSFVKFANAYTDDEGYFEMDRTFTSDVRYRLVFKNRKGFGIGMNMLLVPASVSTLGSGTPAGVSVVVDEDSERKLFARCVVNNAGWDYFQGCTSGGVSIKTPPSNLRIWLFEKMNRSSSMMLQQGVMIDGSIIGQTLGEYAFLVKLFLPDLTLGLSGKPDYASIYSTAVHEMAHASHYAQAGNDYWEKYIKFILSSFASSGGITYGVGTEADHGYCEVGEMWAYYVQAKLFRERYEDEASRTFGTSFWFSPQILLYLDDRGLDRFKIFKALTSDVTDREILQAKLSSLYPECKSIISQAFIRYN